MAKYLYATIPYMGGEYTITYRKEKTSTGASITGRLSGYGKFPYDEYKDIPVIRFDQAPNIESVVSIIKLPDDIMPNEQSDNYSGTMDTYLNAIKSKNIPIERCE